MTEEMIKRAEELGAKRWQKGEMDRLYINSWTLGYTYTKYNTGNISTSYLNGNPISNGEMRRVLSAKSYIDVADGKLHTNYSNDEYKNALNAFYAQCMA